MSSREYVLAVKLKDPQGFFQQIKNLEENGVGGATRKAAKGGGGLMGKLENLNVSSLAKMAGIALGVGTLVGLVVKSSGILQGVFAMFQSAILLILKPIGDFIGLMLRPIMVALLTQVIIPFYKHVIPWVREYGPKVGAEIVGAFSGGGGALGLPTFSETTDFFSGMGLQIQTAWDTFTLGLTVTLGLVPSLVFKAFTDMAIQLSQLLTSIPGVIFGVFTTAATQLSNLLAFVPMIMWGVFSDTAIQLSQLITGVPGMIVAVFSGLADSLVTALASIPGIVLNAILSWIPNSLGIPGASANRGRTLTGGRTTVAAIADTL